MARAIQKPLAPKIGNRSAVFVVFILSGLLHELAITVIIREGYGLPTLFFIFHGICVLLEKEGKWLRYACLLSLIIGLPILFPQGFVTEIINPTEQFWEKFILFRE